ncbi:hypothetical protein JTB14_035277 [Gonioctena quinquepunctata]|nr:hypothetical protein JTB14_035277 [Gonioctena quinquepunctata]
MMAPNSEENILDTLNTFKTLDSITWSGRNQDKSLFEVWWEISKEVKNLESTRIDSENVQRTTDANNIQHEDTDGSGNEFNLNENDEGQQTNAAPIIDEGQQTNAAPILMMKISRPTQHQLLMMMDSRPTQHQLLMMKVIRPSQH